MPPDYNVSSVIGAQGAQRTASRIDNDIGNLKMLSQRVSSSRERIMRHAQTLGYYNGPKDPPTSAAVPTPMVLTLTDAISELDREIEQLSGALNVFD